MQAVAVGSAIPPLTTSGSSVMVALVAAGVARVGAVHTGGIQQYRVLPIREAAVVVLWVRLWVAVVLAS